VVVQGDDDQALHVQADEEFLEGYVDMFPGVHAVDEADLNTQACEYLVEDFGLIIVPGDKDPGKLLV
jgi:hypothetical protein